jgi:serine protease AprX
MQAPKLMAILAVLAPLSGLALQDEAAKASDAAGRIAGRVMADTEAGRTTEALVILREQADLRPAASLPTKAAKGRFVFDTLRAVANRSQAPLRAMLDQRGVPYQEFYIVNMIKVTGHRALMLELAARADVARIDANPHVRASLPLVTGVDAGATSPRAVEWNVSRVKAPDVWALGFRGDGMVVADADTGVDWEHPALKPHYRGWDGVTADHDFNWHDATSQHSSTPVDPHSHGTFTTSQTVGDDGAGNQVGVAPGAKWIGCRNMDATGTGSPATYTECFQWLMAPYPIGGDPTSGDPSLAPDSINNSWGCPPSEGCNKATLRSVVQAVRAAGIFPAVSAGNSGPACFTVVDPPAIYEESFSVGATTMTNAIASFSSRGPVSKGTTKWLKPDISAPGVNIRGAVPGTGYQSGWSGTSMAAPHVAGGVALLWQAKPALVGNIDATEKAFTSTAVPKTSSQSCGLPGSQIPNNTFGWGVIDLLGAVEAP